MDATKHNHMKTCPTNAKSQCQFWSTSIVTVLFVLAALLIVAHLDSFDRWHTTTKIAILTITAISAAWSLWAVRTLYAIITWWIEIKDKVTEAIDMLHDARSDIKDIKSINHELSSR